MTEEKGAVGIRVAVPVLGTVTGVRSLQDIIAGNPVQLPTDQPAVVTRDPGEPIKPITTTPDPTPVVTRTPDPTPARPVAVPKPVGPAKSTPSSANDPEVKAKRLMQLAENYLRAGMKSMAVKKLKEIVKTYPKTKTAEEAEDKLIGLEG